MITVPDDLKKYFYPASHFPDMKSVTSTECDPEFNAADGTVTKWYATPSRARSERNALRFLHNLGIGPAVVAVHVDWDARYGYRGGRGYYYGVEVRGVRIVDRGEKHPGISSWMEEVEEYFTDTLDSHDLEVYDFHSGNIGLTEDDRVIIIDGGVICGDRSDWTTRTFVDWSKAREGVKI